MKRSKRLEPVGALAQETERECAVQMASVQGRVADAERRCAELKRYLEEYRDMFRRRATAGIGVTGMRDYQTFIARLGEAVRQQEGVIAQLQADCERARARWLEAAARSSAVRKVIANVRSEDQRLEERRSQKESDEHAQRLGGAR
ncbi:MAG TPA: flagellar export protein FliJ [Steroidobacteraceae bacterium]|nr:flagellar export protein FliJ [Steroidobacteraceae bacterium]